MSGSVGLTKLDLLFGFSLLIALGLSYAIYSPGLTGPLLLDDFWNLRPLGEGGGIQHWDNLLRFVFANDSGPTGRPVAMLSFLIDAQDWPPLVAALKYTNIMLHLLTGSVLCWFLMLLNQACKLGHNQSVVLALLLTCLWLWHPLNVSTTLYVVQRMTQLMTLFSLAALVCYLQGRALMDTRPRKGFVLLCASLFPFGLLAVLSKENGVLLLLLVLILEATIFRGSASKGLFRLWFRLGVLVPLAIAAAYLLLSTPGNLSLYEIRHFNLLERLLTEARILCLYLVDILLPNTFGAGLYHDDFSVSTSLLQPWTTLLSVLFLAALTGAAIMLRKSQPVFSFGVLWFFAAHLLESTYLPLELYFEHRNYLAMVGPLFAAAWYLRLLYFRLQQSLKSALPASIALVLVLCLGLTWQQTRVWGNTLELPRSWATARPASIRAQLAYADSLTFLRQPQAAMERLQIAHRYYPLELTLMLYMWNLACEFGLEPPYSLAEIVNTQGLEYYRDDVNHHLQILLENLIAQNCVYPDEATMVSLFNKVGEFALPDFRRAGYHFYFSDLYVYYGRLNPALINLTRAFEANPVPQIPIRQAILSASAGNFEDGLIFLGRAREANSKRNPLLPSAESEIDQLQADMRRRLARSTQGN